MTNRSIDDRLRKRFITNRPNRIHKERVCMKEYRLAEGEAKFADLIWDNEPVGSMQLVKLCEAQLGWKKSTTYTVLKMKMQW